MSVNTPTVTKDGMGTVINTGIDFGKKKKKEKKFWTNYRAEIN